MRAAKARKMLPLFKILLAALGIFALYLLISVWIPPLFQQSQPPEDKKTAEELLYFPENAVERVRCVDDNTEALLWRLRVIGEADESLTFATFSFEDEESGRDIMAALLAAADRGVRVRMLVDGISYFTSAGRSAAFQALAAADNVEIRIYNPVDFLQPWKVNYRMHDKYIIADDRVFMLGGRNTKNLSLGAYQERRDYDRDIVVYEQERGAGSALAQLRCYFGSVWNLPDAKPLEGRPDAAKLEALRRRGRELRDVYPEAYAPTDWTGATQPCRGIRLLHNPAAVGNKEPLLWDAVCTLMQTEESVTVQTPYIICSRTMYEALEDAAEGRRIRIITNSAESGANVWGCTDFLNEQNRLRATGAELYEYVGDRSAHTKTVLIGDRLSLVGSFNFDMRSAYLDTELMLLIDSEELNRELQEAADEGIARSRCTDAGGSTVLGEAFEPQTIPAGKKWTYALLRVLIHPFRHLL